MSDDDDDEDEEIANYMQNHLEPKDQSNNTNNTNAASRPSRRGVKQRQTPFQLIGKKGNTEEDILYKFVKYNREAANNHCRDPREPTGKYQKCKCLKILVPTTTTTTTTTTHINATTTANGGVTTTQTDAATAAKNDVDDDNKDLLLYAVATFQLHFGKMNKRDQQIKVMDWMRYALNNTDTPRQAYFIPYLAPPNENDNNDKAGGLLKPLFGHKICQGSLMHLLGIGRFWWSNCRRSLDNHCLPPVHHCVGKMSGRKRRFAEEEESDLIQFMEEIIKRVADPTATKKRPNQTDNIIYYLDPSSWSKRYCYKRYCAQRGKNVLTSADGRNTMEDIPEFPGGSKHCISWSAFQKYWVSNYPRLRVSQVIGR
jgi:hypothetical protein